MAGPVVLITGASQGIGAAIAREFASGLPDCRLVLVARNAQALSRVAARCRRAGAAQAEGFACDVSDAAAVAELGRAVKSHFKAVDVLINNAGQFKAASFLDTSTDTFDGMLAANLRSVFLVSREFVPAMAKRRRGHVFNMSSVAGLGPYPGGAAYCAAKFGVTGLSRVMRQELKSRGVRVTVVHPGATWSPSWEGSGVSAERMMPAKDIARCFLDVFRLSDATVVEEITLRPQAGDV